MFLKITQLESFKIRNNILLKNVIPELGKKKFTKSPFVNSCYGLANPSLYIYELCRLVDCHKGHKTKCNKMEDDRKRV